MDLHEIRNATPKLGQQDRYLTDNGSNLSLIVHNLSQESLDFEEALTESLAEILPLTRKFRPIVAGRDMVTLEWWQRGAKEPFYLDEMSDGTVRMLIWATILKSPHLPPLIVLDEPEMGIHVAWLPILANWIKQASRKTQIILITHSPDLFDAFTQDHLEDVLRFKMDAEGMVDISPLKREELADKLEEGWELGDLYRAGDPDFGAWPW